MKARANPQFREMAMKNDLILTAAILLTTVWLALGVGITAMTLQP